MRAINIFILIFSSFLHIQAGAQESSVYMAVMDNSFDLQLNALASRVDMQAIKNSKILDPKNGKSISIYNFNQSIMSYHLDTASRFATKLGVNYWKNLFVFLIQKQEEGAQRNQFLKKAQANPQTAKIISSIVFDHQFLETPLMRSPLHGTHVAGLAIKGTSDQVKLLPIPQLVPSTEVEIQFANLNESVDFQIKVITDYFSSLNQLFKIKSVGVMNASIGFEVTDSLYFGSLALSKMNVLPQQDELKAAANSLNQLFLSEFKKFINQNPQTIFVFAAGNESEALRESTIFQLRSPNVIFVGAVDSEGDFANDFSNFDSEWVDIGANGVNVESLLAFHEGIDMPMTGSSQSSPQVANSLIMYLTNETALRGALAIEPFLQSKSRSVNGLTKFFKKGRILTNSCDALLK